MRKGEVPFTNPNQVTLMKRCVGCSGHEGNVHKELCVAFTQTPCLMCVSQGHYWQPNQVRKL